MARNTSAKHKMCRTLGMKICDSYKCSVVKRNYPPGQHGQKRLRAKVSDYGKQLREKQKAKYIYGILERQFRITFDRAQKMKGSTGTNLIRLLERRLDNVVFKSGFASTKRLARQLVNHGHIEVNGRKVTIPSYTVKAGEVIKVREAKRSSVYWTRLSEEKKKLEIPGWLNVDQTAFSTTVISDPKDEELPQIIEPYLIVEFYSR